jgi:hypothetical protein
MKRTRNPALFMTLMFYIMQARIVKAFLKSKVYTRAAARLYYRPKKLSRENNVERVYGT